MSLYKELLTTSIPSQEITGNEGLVSGIVEFIKAIIKKIVDGFKWLWNKLFGEAKSRTIASVAGEIKHGTPQEEVTITKPVAWACPDGKLGDVSLCNKHIIAYSEAIKKFHGVWLERMKKHQTHIASGLKNAVSSVSAKNISETFELSHRTHLIVDYSAEKQNIGDAITIKTSGHRDFSKVEEMGEKLLIDKETVNKVVVNFMLLISKRKETQTVLEKINKIWEKEFKEVSNLPEMDVGDFKTKFKFLQLESNILHHMGKIFDKEFDIFTNLSKQLQH